VVSLIDSDRQWFKAKVGVELAQTPRSVSFCNYAIAGVAEIMEVPDTRLDERFAQNPFVTGDQIRMYVGAVLRDRHGRALGLCACSTGGRGTSRRSNCKLCPPWPRW